MRSDRSERGGCRMAGGSNQENGWSRISFEKEVAEFRCKMTIARQMEDR